MQSRQSALSPRPMLTWYGGWMIAERFIDAHGLPEDGLSREGTGGSVLVKKQMKLDADERKLLASVERGEWKAVSGVTRERVRYAGYAEATGPQRPKVEQWALGHGP